MYPLPQDGVCCAVPRPPEVQAQRLCGGHRLHQEARRKESGVKGLGTYVVLQRMLVIGKIIQYSLVLNFKRLFEQSRIPMRIIGPM